MIRPSIIVHGGCGRVDESSIPERRDGVLEAAEAGWRLLKEGGSSVDAVEAAVMVLEDIPLFNAGRGSVLNSDGVVETDAAIMEGASLSAGAVAGLSGFLNPINIARRVMDKSPHVLLICQGAERFALREGFRQSEAGQLAVDYRRQEWEREHGTVGAVACDRQGHLAAATSTGGSKNKLPGRVGDSPLIGAGTYANSQIAVSCTGDGENIMRMTLSRLAAFLYREYEDAETAITAALRDLEATLGGEVGLIGVDCRGRSGFTKNSPHMPVFAIEDGEVSIYC